MITSSTASHKITVLERRYITAVIVNITLLLLAYLTWPTIRPLLVKEDQLLESATALILLSATALGCWLIWQEKQRKQRWPLLTLPALTLLAFLDEISFGLYWLNRDVPRVQGVTIDGAHDVLDLGFRFFDGRSQEFIIIIAFIAAYTLILAVNWVSEWWRQYPSLPFFLTAIFFFMMAVIIDLGVVKHQFLFFIEELFEFNTGLALFFAVWAIPHTPLPDNSWRQRLPKPQINHWLYLRDLLYELVARNMKLRYKRSVLGIAWSLLNPLFQLLVFGFVFNIVLPLEIEDYASFVFIGLLVWTWFDASLMEATNVIVNNPDLIRRPGFPIDALPIVAVTTNLVHFLLALPILFIFLWLGNTPFSINLLWLPLLISLQFLLILCFAYIVAVMHVYFRDTQHLLGILLMLAFYLTPIFYDAVFVPDALRPLYNLNPMVHMVTAYRAIFLGNSSINFLALTIIGIASLAILYIGRRIFQQTSYRFIDEL